MKIKSIAFIIVFALSVAIDSHAQTMLLFGTVKKGSDIQQARFEVTDFPRSITYAPYGITPVAFRYIKSDQSRVMFSWQYRNNNYKCTLTKKDSLFYTGSCIAPDASIVEMTLRNFSEEDSRLQGNFIKAGPKDIQILDRAIVLLNNGKSWDSTDNRICDASTYPYRWSLFCALHQASIETDGDYRHLRPAIKAVRQAIDEVTGGKKYAHLLRDFNNEAKDFSELDNVLSRAKEIVEEQIQMLAGM